jgi:hypothetical protein
MPIDKAHYNTGHDLTIGHLLRFDDVMIVYLPSLLM